MNSKVYSPPYAAITSCSTREFCSLVGWFQREYASWGQATICQIRPIAHVRCAVYSVLLSRVCVANVSCMHARPFPPFRAHHPHRVASLHRANFRKAPRGVRLPVDPLRAAGMYAAKRALGHGTDSRNVVYDFHHAAAPFSIPLKRRVTEAEVRTVQRRRVWRNNTGLFERKKLWTD